MSIRRHPVEELFGKQRRYLRSLGHHLDPVVHVGQRGLTEAVVEKTIAELEHHELIKLKISRDCPAPIKEAAAELADATGSHLAQVLGRTVLLYRRRGRDPEIKLPRRAPR